MKPPFDISASMKILSEREPGLFASLNEVTNIDQARELIMQAAERHGVMIDASVLDEQLQAAQAEVALSDEELADVTGGSYGNGVYILRPPEIRGYNYTVRISPSGGPATQEFESNGPLSVPYIIKL